MKSFVKFENTSKTGSILVEVTVSEKIAPHGKNIVLVKPVSGEGEMKVWAEKVITKE